jgi:hypothetical protein
MREEGYKEGPIYSMVKVDRPYYFFPVHLAESLQWIHGGAKLTAADSCKWTALHWAEENAQEAMVRLLRSLARDF